MTIGDSFSAIVWKRSRLHMMFCSTPCILSCDAHHEHRLRWNKNYKLGERILTPRIAFGDYAEGALSGYLRDIQIELRTEKPKRTKRFAMVITAEFIEISTSSGDVSTDELIHQPKRKNTRYLTIGVSKLR